mmetsp:Transcript_33010/g.98231  ORF Transcript_33010/g.98231 Transcript_33010/m.98231 type:complete len:127 (+) Transcript_33010:1029-1409(+)
MNQELVQNAMNFANDSLHTSLCLQFPAGTIGATCVYLSGRACKVRPTGGRSWTDLLGIDPDDVATVSLQIMELIAETRSRGKAEPSLFGEVRKDLDRMREGKGAIAPPRKNPVVPAGPDPKRQRYQ